MSSNRFFYVVNGDVTQVEAEALRAALANEFDGQTITLTNDGNFLLTCNATHEALVMKMQFLCIGWEWAHDFFKVKTE